MLRQEEDVDFFFAGFCPQRRRVRIAKFWVDFDAERTLCEEIFTDDKEGCEAVGIPDAVDRFRQLFQLSCSAPPCRVHFAAIRRLKDVIDEGVSPHVTGAIQYGEFEDENFRTFATSMLSLEDDRLRLVTYTAGTDTKHFEAIAGYRGPFVLPPKIAPFNDDIAAFESDHFWNEDGSGTPLDGLVRLEPFSDQWASDFAEEAGYLCERRCQEGPILAV